MNISMLHYPYVLTGSEQACMVTNKDIGCGITLGPESFVAIFGSIRNIALMPESRLAEKCRMIVG